jgi:predicted metal-dependent TIM-barrel fold hydrolase
MRMVNIERLVYGADYGVPYSTEDTMEENWIAALEVEEWRAESKGVIPANSFNLFPAAARRALAGDTLEA